MLRIEQNQEQLQIFFKDLEIIRHSNAKPCVEIGTGQEKYRVQKKHYGFYKPKDYKLRMRKLRSYQIVEKTEHLIKIEFENFLKIQLEVVSDRLEITLMLLNLESHSENWNRFMLNIPATKSESIYGLGEQFSVLNIRGKHVPLWTQEPGLGRDHSIPSILAELYMGAGGAWHTTYFPQPTFVSSRNYFVHVESYAYAKFDFRNNYWHRIHIWEIPKRIIIDVKSSAVEVIQSLSAYLGRQPSIPDWAIDGMWLGIGGGLEKNSIWSVQQKLKRALDAGVKISAIWSQDWTGLYKSSRFETRLFWNWRYDAQRYPNLQKFIKNLNNQGIKFLGYNNCFLMKHGDLYKEGNEKGYLIKKKDGKVYNLRMGSFSAGMLDLTNPYAWQWIKQIIKENMIGIGLNGWMCDYGEYLPTNCALFSGEDPKMLHNKYPVLWAQANYEAIKEVGKFEGTDAIVFFNRSGNAGISKYAPMIWAGDQMATFSIDNGLASVINAGISLGFCSIGHFHSDIGGLFTLFGIKREKELFMRWTELAAFTCIMRTHEGHHYEDKINWTFDSDQETLEHFAKFSRIHSHLKPYTRHLLDEYQATGLSLIRHPYIHYESDQCLHRLHYQYLYGKDLLVAPVYLKGKKIWKVYLPKDDWIHIWSNKSYNGGWIYVAAPIGEPPIFYRASSEFSRLFNDLKNL